MGSDLIWGLKYGKDMKYICRLVQNGADVNAEDKYGITALMIASGIEYQKPANLSAMKLLIQNGADVNAIYTRYRHTSLIAASGFNNRANLQAIKLLIENGADVNAVDIYGATPLMYAAGIQKNGMADIEAFKLLLENGADMSIANIYGHTVFTVCTYPYNSDNLHLFQSAINIHYRRENLIFTAAASNNSTTAASNNSASAASNNSTTAKEPANKIAKFIKISNGSRQDWKRLICSFSSNNIEKCV